MRKTIIAAVCICAMLFTAPNASAESAPKKVSLTSVKTISQSQIDLAWKKASGASGYQIFCNDVKVKTTTKLSFSNTNLKDDTKYTYKVRAYKKYKQKKWYNKKTKKWQVKKPKKKYRGKSKKVTAYKYGAFSSSKSATTLKKEIVTNESLTLLSAPDKVYAGSEWTAKFKLPTKGSISCLTENKDIVSVKMHPTDPSSIRLDRGRTAGETTITVKFTPDKGYRCTGTTSISFKVKNTIFPPNDDGSYTVTAVWEDAISSENTYVGGYWREFGNIINELPSGAVVDVSVSNMDRSEIIEGTSWSLGWARGLIQSSSNPNVATYDNTNGLIFVAPGQTDIVNSYGNVLHFTVSE